MIVKKRDLTVGMFVLVAIIMLAFATMVLRHWDLFNTRNTYYVLFFHVRQLDIGSPVLAYGVNVGTVAGLEYIDRDKEARHIRVTIHIDKKMKLYSNAQLRVNPAQVIGTTTLIIDNIGGPEKGKGAHLLAPGEEIIAVEPPGMESVMNEALEGVSKLLNDEQTQVAFKGTMINLESVTKRMDETFRQINEQFVPLMKDLKSSSANLNKLLTDARTSTNRAADSITSASESFRGTSADYAKVARSLDRQLAGLGEKIQATIDQLQTAVAGNQKPLADTLNELKETSRALREVMEKINHGEGSLGKLVNDPRPFQELQVLIEAISQKLTGGGGAGASTFPQVKPRAERGAGSAENAEPPAGGGSTFPKVKSPGGKTQR